MNFSIEWEQQYSQGKQLSIWPWSDLVSYIYRYSNPNNNFHKVLELGCGAGANINLFLELGFEYWAIEGSPTIVSNLHSKYPNLEDRILLGDFTQDLQVQEKLDCIVDRSSLTHNTTQDILKTLRMAHDILREGGKFIGIDWFSTEHMDSSLGNFVDTHTRTDISTGQFKGAGEVHFSDHPHLVEIFAAAGFSLERLEHKISQEYLPSKDGHYAWWNFVAVKS